MWVLLKTCTLIRTWFLLRLVKVYFRSFLDLEHLLNQRWFPCFQFLVLGCMTYQFYQDCSNYCCYMFLDQVYLYRFIWLSSNHKNLPDCIRSFVAFQVYFWVSISSNSKWKCFAAWILLENSCRVVRGGWRTSIYNFPYISLWLTSVCKVISLSITKTSAPLWFCRR